MTEAPWKPLVPEDAAYVGGGFAVVLRVPGRELRKLLRALGGIDFDLLRIEPATRDRRRGALESSVAASARKNVSAD